MDAANIIFLNIIAVLTRQLLILCRLDIFAMPVEPAILLLLKMFRFRTNSCLMDQQARF
jgi:hypothetical protein